MIRRERPPTPPPTLAERAPTALEELRAYSRRHAEFKTQRRWPFDRDLVSAPDVVERLVGLFDAKCAYCESPVPEPIVDWFRPPEEAMQLDGTVDRDHYWSLVYEWANLYPVCPTCRSLKGDRFPVLRRRAAPEARGEKLEQEGPLLLDPCHDQPERVLGYERDGAIVPTDRRATITVDVLVLNRPDLLTARQAAAAETEELLGRLADSSAERLAYLSELRGAVASSLPYAGIRRWVVRSRLSDRRFAKALLGADATPEAAAEALGIGDDRALRLASRAIARIEVMAEAASGADFLAVARGSIRVERAEIRNFKAIDRLELIFPEPLPDREPWLLLLGENGVGKSSALKAVALALLNEEERARRVPDASTCMRRGSGARTGEIRVTFSDGNTRELGFGRNSPRFKVAGDASAVVALGYGPTRLPPPPELAVSPTRLINVDNLFDPRAPLSDVEHWLADVEAIPTQRFNLHATDLKTLLPMSDEDRLRRRSGRLYATSYGVTVPLSELSDGYQSVIALAADLIMHLSQHWESMRSAEGLVLLDELEVHLHPQWRMTIVSLLRTVFPMVRFIATTHDPLSLQQTEPGEVLVLRRGDRGGVEASYQDVPKGLRADQLLTGDWFGLATTTDSDTVALLTEHSRLLLQSQTKAVQARRTDLEQQLRARLGHFAETSVERIALGVAAEVVQERAEDPVDLDVGERKALSEEIMNAVRRR